jgi:hypothetical protein
MPHKDEHFEFAGKTFLAKGTSGLPTTPVQYATGRPRPVRRGLNVGGRDMQEAGTSGAHPSPVQVAKGRPVRPDSGIAISSAIGTHRPVGQPTRIA